MSDISPRSETSVTPNTKTESKSWLSWLVIPSIAARWNKWSWKPTSSDMLAGVEKKILQESGLELEQTQVNAGDHQINTIKVGNGPPLVMLHGFGAGIGFWICNLKVLAQHHTVYAIDLPGFGRSSRLPFSGKSFEEAEEYFVTTIEQWRKEVKLEEQFDLLGHSFGGYLASAYALKHPQNINHLILADPWGIPRKEDSQPRKIPLRWKLLRFVITSFNPLSAVRVAGPYGPYLVQRFRKDIEMKFNHIFPDTSIVSQYIYHMNAQNPSGEIAFGFLNETLGWAKAPMAPRLVDLHNRVAVTFLYGETSWMDKEAGLRLKNTLGERAQFYVVPKAGHHIYADNHEFFNTTVISSGKKAREYQQNISVTINV